jgi:hypothetical protein
VNENYSPQVEVLREQGEIGVRREDLLLRDIYFETSFGLNVQSFSIKFSYMADFL